MENITLISSFRTDLGKGSARKIRKEGLAPAIFYKAGQEPTLITINAFKLQLAFEKSGNPNHLVDIQIKDKVVATCLVKDVQRHPVTGVIRHVDFYEVEADKEITIDVPVEVVGKSIGVQMGGTLRNIRRSVVVTCKPKYIPPTIKVDVSKLDVGKFLKVSEIQPPNGIQIEYNSDYNLFTVIKRRGKE